MRSATRWATLGLLGIWGCSGDANNPPPTSTVATVEVLPGTATISVSATVRLTATPRDSLGTALSGIATSWSTSAPVVATVSNSGLVTAVAGGTATITATAGGKVGHAVITVVSSDYGPVVAKADIGPSGGTVGNNDVAITIPSGAFGASRSVELIRDTISPPLDPANSASAMYFVNGLPAGVTVQTRVRIRTTGSNSGIAAIALLRPGVQSADSIGLVMGLKLFDANDSSGYVVATIAMRGRTSWAGLPPMFRRAAGRSNAGGVANFFNPSQLMADAEIAAMLNLSRASAAGNKFEVWGFGPAVNMQAKVDKTAGYVDQAYTTLTGMNYSLAFRQDWPFQIFVHAVDYNGAFVLTGGWPQDLNQSYIEYNKANTDLTYFPGTVIHEMFHFVKSGIFPLNSMADFTTKGWLDEATSTWMAEKHPAIVQPFINPTALSWRDSMYSGLNSQLNPSSGYGKAPMIKYIAKRWGDAKVKEILDLAHGMDPTTAFLTGIPEAPKLWWPDMLAQFLGGSLYPWTVDQLMPRHMYALQLELGRDPSWITDWMYPLGVEGELVVRDTAMFGPNFMLPVYLKPEDIGSGTILAFLKTAASANFRPLAGGDTVLIPGYLLQRTDSILLLLTPTNPVPPYSTSQRLRYFTDLRVPQADWYFPTVSNLNSTVAFSCDKPGNTVTMNMSDNAISLWNLLSVAGTWKRSGVGARKSEIHTWAPTPEYADSLSKYQITLQSTLTTGTNNDTIRFQAHLGMSIAALRAMGRAPAPAGFPWWIVVPLGAVALAFRRRTRTIGIALVGVSIVVLASCEIGQITLAVDESLEYTFTKIRFTADPAKPGDPVMQLYQGAGKTTLTSYRSEYWSYVTDGTGAKTDSTRVLCTGSGTATYQADGVAYNDGYLPPKPATVASVVAQILGRDSPQVRAYLKDRGH